jgi:non-ribosomal peptide synthetase component E (peptide arylation enzyme)
MGVARQKWPQHVEVMDNLPRTPAGKVKKVELKQDLARRLEPI